MVPEPKNNSSIGVMVLMEEHKSWFLWYVGRPLQCGFTLSLKALASAGRLPPGT